MYLRNFIFIHDMLILYVQEGFDGLERSKRWGTSEWKTSKSKTFLGESKEGMDVVLAVWEKILKIVWWLWSWLYL
jgi:hypothetical protein